MLEKIKILKNKGEILKALISLADDEKEVKQHKQALKNVISELEKMLSNLDPKPMKNDNGTAKNLGDILSENDII